MLRIGQILTVHAVTAAVTISVVQKYKFQMVIKFKVLAITIMKATVTVENPVAIMTACLCVNFPSLYSLFVINKPTAKLATKEAKALTAERPGVFQIGCITF